MSYTYYLNGNELIKSMPYNPEFSERLTLKEDDREHLVNVLQAKSEEEFQQLAWLVWLIYEAKR